MRPEQKDVYYQVLCVDEKKKESYLFLPNCKDFTAVTKLCEKFVRWNPEHTLKMYTMYPGRTGRCIRKYLPPEK